MHTGKNLIEEQMDGKLYNLEMVNSNPKSYNLFLWHTVFQVDGNLEHKQKKPSVFLNWIMALTKLWYMEYQ